MIYIACEDMDFVWKEYQVTLFEEMWARGMPLTEIAKKLRRSVDEVFVLALDRARAGAIQKRKGGIFGHAIEERMMESETNHPSRADGCCENDRTREMGEIQGAEISGL